MKVNDSETMEGSTDLDRVELREQDVLNMLIYGSDFPVSLRKVKTLSIDGEL